MRFHRDCKHYHNKNCPGIKKAGLPISPDLCPFYKHHKPQKSKVAASSTSSNIDYTAVLRVELSRLRSTGFFGGGTIDLADLAAYLNAALKAAQHCA